jgi:glutamine synthetase
VESIINGTNYTDPEKSIMRIGVDGLPSIPKDTTDRNRTSPLAFTGNKFEFRMLGASQSIANPNIALNTIMAEELGQFADILEKAEDFEAALQQLVCKTFTDHQRIIFNGNGYSQEWCKEAESRGLSNLSTTAKALPQFACEKNIDLVTRRGIFTRQEFLARQEIHLEAYCKIVNIEARTAVDIALHQILPAALKYTKTLCDSVIAKQAIQASHQAESALISRSSDATDAVYAQCIKLQEALASIPESSEKAAHYYSDVITAGMAALRKDADILEALTDKSYWPYPTYSDLLFY